VFDRYFLACNANANIEECGHEMHGVLYAVQNIVSGPGGVGLEPLYETLITTIRVASMPRQCVNSGASGGLSGNRSRTA
jgi:hypothetical protein